MLYALGSNRCVYNAGSEGHGNTDRAVCLNQGHQSRSVECFALPEPDGKPNRNPYRNLAQTLTFAPQKQQSGYVCQPRRCRRCAPWWRPAGRG